MNTNQALTKQNFAPGTSRRPRAVHSLALRIAEELDFQMSEEERERRQGLADRLRELRGIRTQQWVADQVGVTLRAYQAWESGSGGIAGSNIEALAKLYSVPEDFIVYGSDRWASPDQLSRIESMLEATAARLERIEDLLSDRELTELESEVAPPRSQPAGRRASGERGQN